ncbi:hypothetical protein [Prevotella multiformis]|uniref:Uncharacterized protein n=1 Tax=Prevotella multiformis DSM 16608 TaxID=888743 RepID=F0F3E9_9BACT|nr:hypothetical protein [Prevotella multiformis]EGC21365.1 hypothetical protein HMPREF9141_0115 [Prevotella multiformis DSM 16608]
MTKTEDIRRLLDRYYDGQATEEEESTLFSCFRGDDTDAVLEEERAFFTALQPEECPVPEGLEGRISRQVSQWNTIETGTLRTARHSNLRWIVGIAASFLLLFAASAIVYQREHAPVQSGQDTYANTKDAYAETSRALMKFSKTLNRGIKATEDITKKTSD